jgi:hypothetical protein
LVGAEDGDIGRVTFPAGRSDLTPPQRERVALLRSALADRPELALELQGPYAPEMDGPVLQRRKAVDALAERLREQGRDVSSPSLTAESTVDMLEAMFAELYPDANLDAIRERFTRSEDEVADGGQLFDAVSYRNHLAEQVIAAQTVTEAELAALGEARAAAVRDVTPSARHGGGRGRRHRARAGTDHRSRGSSVGRG